MTRRRAVGLGSVALAAVLTVSAVPPGEALGSSPTSVTDPQWAPSAEHSFSDPLWMPVRDPIRISCTYSNCPGPFHGYWAIDMLGELDLPIHAAGAGIAHIGGTGSACVAAGSSVGAGNWVWIDHGGGIVTRYHHLNRIDVSDGQLVTPDTRIGTMGHSGDFAPCATNYLHFEVRSGGKTGMRIPPGPLLGCSSGRALSFPSHWGVDSWNSVTKGVTWTPALDNSCLPTSSETSSAPPAPSVVPGNGVATVRWEPPAGSVHPVDRYVVSQEIWGPSVSAWHSVTHRSVDPATSQVVFSGLANGRTYRYRVAAHNAAGYSNWTPYVTATPATSPTTPVSGRWLRASSSSVGFAWWKSSPRGTPVTGYTLALRRRGAGAWQPWTYVFVPPQSLSHTWRSLSRNTTYQLAVRAESQAGSSAWSKYRTIRTKR